MKQITASTLATIICFILLAIYQFLFIGEKHSEEPDIVKLISLGVSTISMYVMVMASMIITVILKRT